MSTSDFDSWLAGQLEALSLDADVYGGYVSGIMADEGDPLEERVEAVCEILSGATDESLDDFKGVLEQRWRQQLSKDKEADEAAKTAKQQALEREKEEDRRLVEEAEEQRKARAQVDVQRSREERQERERLLNEYGFDTDAVDEEGNPMEKAEAPAADSNMGMDGNTNRQRVHAAQKEEREVQKAAHVQKVARDKMLLEKDRMRKELAKKKPQKQERRSGRG